jgi:hypothetical protein
MIQIENLEFFKHMKKSLEYVLEIKILCSYIKIDSNLRLFEIKKTKTKT